MIGRNLGNIILFILALTVLVTQGFAEQLFKVAVINSQKTLQNSDEGKKVIVQLQEKEHKIKNNLAIIEKEIQALDKKLKTQRFTLTLEVQQQLALDLDNLRTKYNRSEEDSAREWQQLKFRLFGKIRNELFPVIESVAKEKEFSLVLDFASEGVVYFNPAIDITDEVIKRYNASKVTKK